MVGLPEFFVVGGSYTTSQLLNSSLNNKKDKKSKKNQQENQQENQKELNGLQENHPEEKMKI